MTDKTASTAGYRQPPEVPTEILVVDDNRHNLTAIEAALGDLGRRLVKARSGDEALRQLLHRDFALIILDVQMPGMDGFETARLIRERARTRHVPIIFVTAYNRKDTDILEGYRLGASDFLFKPIVPEVLRAKAQVFVDLQERTAEVRRQADRLRELERLESRRRLAAERERWESERLREESRRKDEFLAVLAHELRNPLTPVVTGIELLGIHARGNEAIRRIRDMMNRQAQQLVRLIDDLLDVARISSGKINVQIDRIKLGDLVRHAASSIEDLVKQRGHTLCVEGTSDELVVAADPVRLTQVIANLLNNAARYTPDGGHIRLSWARDGDDAVIRVADNGNGIAPEMLDRIFDRFVQVDGHTRGLGLGLALVQRLVAMHGGRVNARSAGRGQGSEFSVWLPLAQPSLGDETTAAGDSHRQPLNIVLVGDHIDPVNGIGSLLTSWGHRVESADGDEGAEIILRSKPHAAIIDVGAPNLDGYALARRLREQLGYDGTRLIAISGFARESDRRRALEAGFDTHITRPARPEDLQWALTEMTTPQGKDNGHSRETDAQAGA